MRFYLGFIGTMVFFVFGFHLTALAAPSPVNPYQLTVVPHDPVDHSTAPAHDPVAWQLSKVETVDTLAPNLSAQSVPETQDHVYPAPGNSIPEVTPQHQPEAIPQDDSGENPYPVQPVDPKKQCLFAEFYVKYGSNPQLVDYYRIFLETHCQDENSLVEKCAWLQEKKNACQTAVLKTPQAPEAAIPHNDGPQWEAADKPKLESPSRDCNDYQEWFEEICIANPPAPKVPDDDMGEITAGASSFALSGGACSLSGAGTTTDTGMIMFIAVLIGLSVFQWKRQP